MVRRRLPLEFKQRLVRNQHLVRVESTLQGLRLNTVCRSARCPNRNRCFSEGTATFMIMGSVCTRRCRFCAVSQGQPRPLDPGEPKAVAQAVARLDLEYAVVTSVTRDDLPDGGAGHFVRTVQAIRERCPGVGVELLIPDFMGRDESLQAVFDSRPEVLNHNIETVPRLYSRVRPQADYQRSLRVISLASRSGLLAKSGLMVGLGETLKEVVQTLKTLADCGCRLATVGQYLAPSAEHFPVERIWSAEEFQRLGDLGSALGMVVVAGPLVRSSYQARQIFRQVLSQNQDRQLKPTEEGTRCS